MASVNTIPNYPLLPRRHIGVLKLPANCLSPEVSLGPGARRRRKKSPPAVRANLNCSSFGSWGLKRTHYHCYHYKGSWSIVCKGWESEGDLALEAEILEFMKESEKPGAFPTRQELLDAGRVDLVQAIKKKGGWLSLGWDSDDENEVQSSQRIDITGDDGSGTGARHSQERVVSGNSLEIGGISSGPATTTQSASSLQMEDTHETGIEGILSGLEKQRNLSFGINLAEDLYSARVLSKHGRDGSHPENSKDADSGYLGRSNTGSLDGHNKGAFEDSGTDFSRRRPVSNINGSESSLKPEMWRAWSLQRAGFLNEEFEAAEISYNKERIHEKDDQINNQFTITESSSEVLDKEKDSSNGEIRRRLQFLELELASTLRLLRSKSEKYVADEAHATSDELQNLSDAWEFHENDIMHAKEKLRSLRAKLAVLEGKTALAIIDARKTVKEKQMKVDSARRALELLRSTYIVWPNSASEVLLSGSFDGWTTQRKMDKSSTGVFSLRLNLYPGRYEIKFIVDGVWRVDPLRPVVHNEGHQNNLLVVT